MIDPITAEIVQRIPQKSAWFGLAWAPNGTRLFVSGGNGSSRIAPAPSPIYAYDYKAGTPAGKVMLRIYSAQHFSVGDDPTASANSVIVLVVPYGTSPAGGGPEAQTIGTGAAVVYTAGHKIEGTWTRQSATEPFHLEAGGQPILITPGRTWVELVDDQHNLADG